MASGADILLLDEPLRALDARLRISLRYELRSLAKALGITTVHVTHDQDEALVMADRIAVIRDGKILQIGTPSDVFDNPNSPFIANFVGQSNFFVGKVAQKRESTQVTDGHLTVEARACDIDIGEEAVVGIKVGNTEIFKDQPGFFSGTVERILFEGRNLHVDVAVEGIGRFSAKVPSWRMGKIVMGDKVNIRWNWDKATVFRMPEKGLQEELRVE
jgi:ABC-type Fe3+/spermidine/putrescine transport system ATPase subunit